MTDLRGLCKLYAATAPFYEQQVVPVFRPLAANFAAWVLRCATDHLNYALFDPFDLDDSAPLPPILTTIRAADLGTGTGVLARLLAERLQSVAGVDLSADMLAEAQRHAPPNLRLLQADIHRLPLRRGAVQLAVSSFGLNASEPKKSLRALAGLLRRGEGMLAFQEWGAEDDCSRIIDETLAEHAPDEIPGLDEALREYYAAPKPWYDQLQDAEDFYEMLKGLGFDLVWVKEAAFATVHLPSVDVFVRYKMAWPMRRYSVAAMSEAARREFEVDLDDNLKPFANADGSFDWSPMLFRVFATL